MADKGKEAQVEEEDLEGTPGYVPPKKVDIDTLKNLDENDESLKKWKEQLLAGAAEAGDDAGDPRNVRAILTDGKALCFDLHEICFVETIEKTYHQRVIIDSMTVRIDGRPDIVFPLNTDEAVAKLKETPIMFKEDAVYRMAFKFRVKKDIVSALKYSNFVYKKGIRLDKSVQMLGSYGPNKEAYQFTTPDEQVPSGMLARGKYTAKSTFTDDDKNNYLSFGYSFEIKKEWP